MPQHTRPYNTNHFFKPGIADTYGRMWPGVPTLERCDTCGQPDNCGDCDCGRLRPEDVKKLGGVLAPGEEN